MKTIIALLIVVLAGALVMALGGLVSAPSSSAAQLLPAACAISLVGLPLFALLSVRSGRKQREEQDRRNARRVIYVRER